MSEELEYETEFEDLPVSQAVKVIRRSDDLGQVPGLPDEEMADPWEMERWVHLQERETLLALHGSRRELEGADRYGNSSVEALEMESGSAPELVGDRLAEQARDIAIAYSCARDDEASERARRRFRYLVDSRLRNRALSLAARMKREADEEKREAMLSRLEELNGRIREMNAIWKECAHLE